MDDDDLFGDRANNKPDGGPKAGRRRAPVPAAPPAEPPPPSTDHTATGGAGGIADDFDDSSDEENQRDAPRPAPAHRAGGVAQRGGWGDEDAAAAADEAATTPPPRKTKGNAPGGWGDDAAGGDAGANLGGWGMGTSEGGGGGKLGGIAADFDDESPAGKPKFSGVSRRKAAQQNAFMTETGGDDGFGTTAERPTDRAPVAGRRAGGGAPGGGLPPAGRNRHDELDDAAEQDIMEIPDLDEGGGDEDGDITTQVAAVPKYRANRVQTIRELDEEAHMLGRQDEQDEDIDFSLLTSVLHSMEQVREGDEVWDPDRLWGEIKRELNLEDEERESSAVEGAAGDAAQGFGAQQEMTSTKM